MAIASHDKIGGENLVRDDITKCSIFSEFSEDEQQEYFSVTEKKVVHNIDTLYYSVMLAEGLKDQIAAMSAYLSSLADKYRSGETEISVGELSFFPFRFSIYEYCLRLDNMFDIFISSYIPNKDTPRVVVQLRSVGLWMNGPKDMILRSYEALQKFLNRFGVVAVSVSENRVDYAYHTNIIQNTTKYFSDRNMLKSLRTILEIYHKVGKIGREIGIDYLSLGNRKSNNVFFRAYNKTKEVIEQNYKGFFIEYWFRNRLISTYDKWVLEHAYGLGTYNSLLVSRIDWYLRFGLDDSIKKELLALRQSCYENSDNCKHIADKLTGVLPEVTIVCNIEFQTKRKFYYTMKDFFKGLPCSLDGDHLLHRLFCILENPKPFLDYLTGRVVSFRSGEGFASWWKRLRSLRIQSLSDGELYRSYARNLDREKLKQRMAGAIAANSVYVHECNGRGFAEDVSDFLCLLNDNDVSPLVFDSGTGQMLEFKYRNYDGLKRRKNRQLKAFLDGKGE